jgi:hypothetical protein
MSFRRNQSDLVEQLDKLLSQGNQSWLLGAGTSVDSGIPLMVPLTNHVISCITEPKHIAAISAIQNELESNCHVEHILSHIADCRAISERKREKNIGFGKANFTTQELDDLHGRLTELIGDTIRWGYVDGNSTENPRKVGTYSDPIVTIENHVEFMEAIFGTRQRNISERRGAIRFFTTNYDTLLEDALALCCIPYWDGFEGGAIGFKSHRFGSKENQSNGVRAHVVKLHGSIDWRISDDGRIWRVRDHDSYPDSSRRVLIYPQSTKYLATQRDPFSGQFEQLRNCLHSDSENLLAICGYSFGDEHINLEIQQALDQRSNKTTIIAFTSKIQNIPDTWINSSWSNRLYMVSSDGVFVKGTDPIVCEPDSEKWEWWKFKGVIKVLKSGPGEFLK